MSKNPNHPFVVKYKDGNITNRVKSNMELVSIFDALQDDDIVTNASDMYGQRELADMKEDVMNSRTVYEAVLESVPTIVETDSESLKEMAKASSQAFLTRIRTKRTEVRKKATKKKKSVTKSAAKGAAK